MEATAECAGHSGAWPKLSVRQGVESEADRADSNDLHVRSLQEILLSELPERCAREELQDGAPSAISGFYPPGSAGTTWHASIVSFSAFTTSFNSKRAPAP